jgi:chemotaxis protein MotB
MRTSRSIATAALSLSVLMLASCLQPAPPPPANPVVPGPQAVSERTLLTVAADVAFAEGGYRLSPAGQARLDEIVPALRALHDSKVTVYGYTDNIPVGPELKARGIVDNLDLSSKRANEVVRFLVARGVDPNMLSAKGRAETHPIAPNDTPEGRARNRRIEVVVEQPT